MTSVLYNEGSLQGAQEVWALRGALSQIPSSALTLPRVRTPPESPYLCRSSCLAAA